MAEEDGEEADTRRLRPAAVSKQQSAGKSDSSSESSDNDEEEEDAAASAAAAVIEAVRSGGGRSPTIGDDGAALVAAALVATGARFASLSFACLWFIFLFGFFKIILKNKKCTASLVTAEGTERLADALFGNTSLTQLDLSGLFFSPHFY